MFEKKGGNRNVAPTVDFSVDKDGNDLISAHRFKTVKEMLHYAFFDEINEDDPWYPISSLVAAFNDNRRRLVASAILIVLDESMSNFQPRTTKTSLMPHLSFIFRKPKPLGTEYKTAADPETGLMTYLEIQKGAKPMRSEPYFADGIGSTAACSVRGLVASAHGGQAAKSRQVAKEKQKRHTLIADSWFGGVRMVEAIKCLRPVYDDTNQQVTGYKIDVSAGANPDSHEVIASVKNNSAWFPKEEMEKVMEDWPSGSYLVLECKAPETNVDLVAIGYKYNSRKCLCFIMSKEAASTKPGARHYTARFPDKFGNLSSRKVPRPEAIGNYFWVSNVIDTHNHLRQFLLGLERHWKTPNPWLRNCTSLVAITAIDVYQALRYHCPHLSDWTVEDFANRLAHDCMTNPYKADQVATTRGFIPVANIPTAAGGQPNRAEGMPNVLFNQMQDITQQFQDMMLNCGASSASFVNPSPSSLGSQSAVGINSSSNNFFFGAPTSTATTKRAPSHSHDPIPIRKKDDNGRPVKRRCVICKKDTHSECGHPRCQAVRRVVNMKGVNQTVYGTAICTLSCNKRPGHDLKCLHQHREDFALQEASERSW